MLAGKPGNQQDTDEISHKSTGQSDAGEYLGFVQIESHTFGIADNRIDGNHLGRHMKEDGEYSIQVDLEGGSGKASVSSPTLMLVKNGRMYAELQWSSSNYDYMIVDGEKFQNESEEGRNSVFTIPVTALDDKMEVIADTLAMGAPHEIDYTLTFYEASIGSKGQLPQEAAKRVVAVAMVIIVGGGILNYFVNKRNRC